MENPEGPALSKGRVKRGSVFGTTPKASCASASGVRPETGMFSICAEVITCPVEAEAVCKIGASLDTVMVSVMAPNSIWISMPRRSLAPAASLSREYRLNPGASAVSW